jgi:hypothetical protein
VPFDRRHIQVSWQFAINGTDEVADTSLHVANINPLLNLVDAFAAIDDDEFTDLFNAYIAMMIGGDVQWASYSRLTSVKAALVDTAGHYVTEPKSRSFSASNAGTIQEILPQSTVVLSLRSGLTLGQANYGRMYLPHTKLPLVDGTPRSSTANAAGLAVDAASFISSVGSTASGWLAGNDVYNMSKLGAGTSKLVTKVGVGRVVDTQRRRRNKLEEDTQFDSV